MNDTHGDKTPNGNGTESAGFTLPRLLPRRPDTGHKGTFGTVAVIGGCAGSSGGIYPMMLGAPALAARSALRAGAGMVRLAVPAPLLLPALSLAPETIGHGLTVDETGETVGHEAAPVVDKLCEKSAAMVVGPGLGTGSGARAITLRLLSQQEVPVVVDADALNLLAQLPDVHNDISAPCVLTPHPVEFRRLATTVSHGAITLDGSNPEQQPEAAAQLARRIGCVVVLKGATTSVSDGLQTWTLRKPNPLLATGGSGDVLSGIIASFIAQHHRLPAMKGSSAVMPTGESRIGLFELACLGVAAHNMSALAWSKHHEGARGGMLASDLLDHLPESVQMLRSQPGGENDG
ncbi:MAG: NAD(P)H-hydrate dehydratase [Phycisphaerales bacterium JB065]